MDRNDIGSEKAARLSRRTAGKPGQEPGWLAKRAWKRLLQSFSARSPAATEVVLGIAVDSEHAFCGEARVLVADEWFRTRDERLLETVVAVGALGSPPVGRLASAAVCGVLDQTWQLGDEAFLVKVLSDADPRLSVAARDSLIRVTRIRNDDRAWAAAGLIATRWLWFPDPVLLDALCGIAADSEHAFCGEARVLVADEWFRTRDERLLETVVAVGALGSPPVGRLASAAVCGVLDQTWQLGDEAFLVKVLEDADPRIGEAARDSLIGVARASDDPRSLSAATIIAGRWKSSRDRVLLVALCGIAVDSEHAFCGEARVLVADEWFRTRDERLLETVVAVGALGSLPVGRLASAAVCGVLDQTWQLGDEAFLVKVLEDADPRIGEAARDSLIRVARQRDEVRATAAATLLAERWVQTRDSDLRPVIIELKALAGKGYPRLLTRALHSCISDQPWKPKSEDLSQLLSETDEGVVSGTRAAIAEARGATADALWSIGLDWARQDANVQELWWDNSLTRLLMCSATPPSADIVDALWVAWLNLPDEALVSRLQSWAVVAGTTESDADAASLLWTRLASRERPPRVEGLFVLAIRNGHPISDRALDYISSTDDALLDEFCEFAIGDEEVRSACIRGRLAPRDGTRRAAWFLLTNQPDEYRAFDADGSLLALAYTAASVEERQSLQDAMRRAGGLDLVQVVVGADRRGRIQTMTAAEIDYLAGALANRSEWSRLWGIVLDLPLGTAIQLMHHFESGNWTPVDDDSRELFDRFRSAVPEVVQKALADVRRSWPIGVHQARIHFNGPVNDVSFAPDSPVLAVAGSQRTAGLIDLRSGRLSFRFEDFSSSVGRVLHIGNSTFVAGERTNSIFNSCSVYVCHADPSDFRGSQRAVASVGGSVTSLANRGKCGFIAGTRSGSVLICDDVDLDLREFSVGDFGLDPENDWPREVTTSPESGVFALLGRELVVANAKATRVVAHGTSSTVVQRAVFAAESVLAVGNRSGEVTLMRIQGRSLTPTYYRNHSGLGGLTAVPERGQVIVADREGAAVHAYSATNLELIGSLVNERAATARSLHASENGDLLAVGCVEGFTDIYDMRAGVIPTTITQPMVSMVPMDIARVNAGIGAARRGRVADALHLLLAALQHRFRFDIELVDTGALKAGDYDIAIAK